MSELLTEDFIFIWAGIVSVSFIIWILLTAKELNDVVDKRKKMNAHIASLANGIVLVAVGLWGYMESSSPTSLIPVVIGAIIST